MDKHCNHILLHTGQNYDYELNKIFFEDLNIREPDYFINSANNSPAKTIGNVISGVEDILIDEKPDAVLVLGDTNSCMSIISAKRLKIPTFHMEAGNRCFDMRVPEEINRRIVDHTADINLPYSSIAREYLLREGISPDTIIKTGSPMFEVLSYFKESINKSKILNNLNLKKGRFFVISAHREENIDYDNNFKSLVSILNTLSEDYDLPVIVSTHPRTQNKINDLNIKFHKNVSLLKPLNFTDYNKLQISSKVTLSDSGTINEEASILNFPALNIREAHERPEGMEETAAMMVGLNIERVMQGIMILEKQPKKQNGTNRIVEDYSIPNVSEKIVKIIHSYTDYVNRVIWKKY